MIGSTSLDRFERLFAADADPWRYDTSAYELRKHALTVATLPRQRFRSAFEPGCANGALTRLLACRSERLVAMDASASAVSWARKRLEPHPHVRVEQGTVPEDWPDGRFDLVVVSEFGYYLDAAALAEVSARIRESLTDDGVLVACHWRHREPDFSLDARAVHAILATGLSAVAHHVERDFLLDVWQAEEAV